MSDAGSSKAALQSSRNRQKDPEENQVVDSACKSTPEWGPFRLIISEVACSPENTELVFLQHCFSNDPQPAGVSVLFARMTYHSYQLNQLGEGGTKPTLTSPGPTMPFMLKKRETGRICSDQTLF